MKNKSLDVRKAYYNDVICREQIKHYIETTEKCKTGRVKPTIRHINALKNRALKKVNGDWSKV